MLDNEREGRSALGHEGFVIDRHFHNGSCPALAATGIPWRIFNT